MLNRQSASSFGIAAVARSRSIADRSPSISPAVARCSTSQPLFRQSAKLMFIPDKKHPGLFPDRVQEVIPRGQLRPVFRRGIDGRIDLALQQLLRGPEFFVDLRKRDI